jgi:hypothetical protein
MGEWRRAYRIYIGRLEGTRTLGRPRRRWEDNIKWVFKKWEGIMDYIDLAQNKESLWVLENVVMND